MNNMKHLKRFNETKDIDLDNIIDLTLVSLKDDGFNIGVVNKIKGGSMLAVRLEDYSNFSINYISNYLLTFFDIIQKKYELLNIICYDDKDIGYTLNDEQDGRVSPSYKFHTIDKLFDKLSTIMIYVIYIIIK